jgi:Gas vesicle synthesis protein GvpL/GvpF
VSEGAPVYVYGVVAAKATGLAAAGGLGDPPAALRVVAAGDLGALVSDLPPGYTPGRREDLEGHQRVLSEAVQAATVLPMRFGVVMDDDETVREDLLERNATDLRRLLADLDGRVQMTLKAFYTEDALLKEVLAEEPAVAQLSREVRGQPEAATREARLHLGQLVAQAVEERRERDLVRLRDEVAPLVADVVVDPAPSDRVAAQLQLLVERDRRADLDQAVERLAAEHEGRLSFRYLGPLAPYSFADLELEAEAH